MIPRKDKRVPGFIDKAKISSGWTMHVPAAVAQYFALEIGDTLEFYNPLVDLPDELTLKFELIAVVVKRLNPKHEVEYDEKTGEPVKIDGVPVTDHPMSGPEGMKYVREVRK